MSRFIRGESLFSEQNASCGPPAFRFKVVSTFKMSKGAHRI